MQEYDKLLGQIQKEFHQNFWPKVKKQISYLLTLVLVLSLCGVMGPVNKTVKAAEYGSTVDITNDFSQTFTMDAIPG